MNEEFSLNFRGRRVVPPLPPGILAAINDMAEPEGSGDNADGSSAATAFIHYTDRSGAETKRRITFKRLSGHFGELAYIDAFCHERGALRQFAIESIDEMICPYTGEVFDPMRRCIELQANGALRISDIVLTELARIVVFMARCDDEFHPLEEGAIEDVFGRYLRHFGGDDATYETALHESRRLTPEDKDVGKALWRLKRCPEGPLVARFVLDACGRIIDADGHHRPEEVRWGMEIDEALRKVAART